MRAEVPGPVPGRVRDSWLGGKGNLDADRKLAEELEARFPGTARAAREARAFTGRAVTWTARQGISQFIVPGSGLPSPGAVHEAARAVTPGARVLYADTDPAARAYAWQAARDSTGIASAEGSAADPAGLLAAPELRAVIDLAAPACAVLEMTLHFMPPAQSREVVAGIASRLAPGSYLVASCAVPYPGPGAEEFIRAYTAARIWRHTVAGIAGWLDGLEIVRPGVTDVRGWRAGMPEPRLAPRPVGKIVGVVARVP